MEPYFRFVKKICEQGKNTARIHYGCRGFVHHHNADFWCSTNPTGIPYQEKQGQRGSAVWPFWPMGGAWLASEFYRQYQYKPDRHFLETEVYPILREAARKSLAYRLEKGSGHTGWSCAWIINLYTILGEADKACEYLRMLLTKSTYPNLWDAHPPFQIDGNFGGLAGIAHMLLQTEEHLIKILPALPNEWEEGSVTGLRGRGDLTISISWDRRGCRADVCAGRYAYKGEFVYCEKTEKIELCAGERKKFDFHRGHRKPDFVKEY